MLILGTGSLCLRKLSSTDFYLTATHNYRNPPVSGKSSSGWDENAQICCNKERKGSVQGEILEFWTQQIPAPSYDRTGMLLALNRYSGSGTRKAFQGEHPLQPVYLLWYFLVFAGKMIVKFFGMPDNEFLCADDA